MTTTPKPDAGGHTAGPWWLTHVRLRFGRGWKYNVKCSSRDTVNDGVADLCAIAVGKTDKEARANAFLISAAPDMLEALKNIENDDQRMPATAWKMIQDAIAKAGGAA